MNNLRGHMMMIVKNIMDNSAANATIRLLSVPVMLFLLLLPISFITGWNAATLIIYWMVITPFAAEFAPTLFSRNKDQLIYSLIGMLIFYAFMVFMIYKHYKTDYFSIMMLSLAVNLVTIPIISRVKKADRGLWFKKAG